MFRISIKRLSQGSHGADVAEVHQALLALGKVVPASERLGLVYGAGTVSAVRALQEDINIPASGVVDEATVQAINAQLESHPIKQRIVRGSVRDANGKPFTGGVVHIFGQGPGGETVLGKSPVNAADGSYNISYQLPPANKGKADLRVAVLNDNVLIETTPSGTSVLTNAGLLEVVDFVLSGEKHLPSTEYDYLIDDLKPFLGARDLADLTEDKTRRDVSLLASQSGYSPDQVAALVLAHKHAKETGTPPPVLYGMIRQRLPVNAAALHAVDHNERVKALKTAAERGLVPKVIAGKKIEDYLAEFMPSPAASLRGLLGRILNDNELTAFSDLYLKNSQDTEAFWVKVAADPAWSSRAADLKFTVQLGVLTNNHVPLVTALKAMPNVRQPSDLARLTEEGWKSLIQTQGVGVPDEAPGKTKDEKTKNYVQQILTQVETAFPTLFFAERLGTSRVATFLKGQPLYDLRHTYPEQYFKQHPSPAAQLNPQDRQQLRTFQRLYRLTGTTKETLALADKGVHSSEQISRMGRKVFAERYKDILTAERANKVYNRAQQTHAVVLALFAEHASALNRTGLYALPRLDSQKMAQIAADNNIIPDWQTLFGTFDLCACRECASVHGPAAYLVDILHFLDERNVRGPLFDRRPDLGEIELSCENTNTPLPLIDLANEVLENVVAPPPPFATLTLAPALEADLAQTTATPALTAAFNPPLQSGARVEAIETGKRWRVWDEPFAYSVVKEGSALKVTARSRQTTGSAAERRATPQYRNSGAYAALSQAVYPWNLPFELSHEEARVFLAHLGVSRRDMIEALQPMPEPFNPNASVIVRMAAERLGLTDSERRILVGEPLTLPHAPEDFWGGGPVTQFTPVQILLDRSGLNYADLEGLVDTWFINPAGTLRIVPKPVEGSPEGELDTCDTNKLQLNGLTPEIMTRLHKFVRLRSNLGWTIPETDRAVRALVPNPGTPALTNEMLVRLDHLRTLSSELRLPVVQTLALWKLIDTTEPHSLYRSLFYNPAVFKPQDDVFRLRPDGQELARTDASLADLAAALQAVFRLNAQGFTALVSKTNGRLNLANLSFIYRHATLSRQLGLTVQDLLTTIELTGLDPFQRGRSQDSLRLVETVRMIRSSDFEVSYLDYLLRRRASPVALFIPAESSLTTTLTQVRADLLAVEAPEDADREKLRKSVVIDRLSAALEIPADATAMLLEQVKHTEKTAQQWLLELVAITAEPLSRDNARTQFEVLEHLLKISGLAHTLGLTGSQLDWLFFENPRLKTAADPLTDPVPFENWFSLVQLQQLRQALNLEAAAQEALLSVVIGAAKAADQAARLAAKQAFAGALSAWLGWSGENVEALIGSFNNLGELGLLNVRFPDDYRVGLIVRLHRAIILLKRLGATAEQASQWCEAVVTDTHAKAIRAAAKAKHDDEAWQKLAAPLQDTLRDKQREALSTT